MGAFGGCPNTADSRVQEGPYAPGGAQGDTSSKISLGLLPLSSQEQDFDFLKACSCTYRLPLALHWIDKRPANSMWVWTRHRVDIDSVTVSVLGALSLSWGAHGIATASTHCVKLCSPGHFSSVLPVQGPGTVCSREGCAFCACRSPLNVQPSIKLVESTGPAA